MKKALALCAALASTIALTSTAEAAWTAPFTPMGVFGGYADGAVYIRGANIGTCNHKNIIAAKTDPEKVLSLALAAFLSGKKLQCNLTSACEGTGQHSYSIVQQCEIVN